jgi:hypothetical protein
MKHRKYKRIGKNYKKKLNLLSFDDAYDALEIARSGSDGWYQAHCPSHLDTHPSLGVKEGDDGELVVHCFFGCTNKEVIDAIKESLKYGKKKE